MNVRAEFCIAGAIYRIAKALSGPWFICKVAASGDAEERAEIDESHVDSTIKLAEEEPAVAAEVFEDALREARAQALNYARVEWDFVPYIRCQTVYVAFERNRSKH